MKLFRQRTITPSRFGAWKCSWGDSKAARIGLGRFGFLEIQYRRKEKNKCNCGTNPMLIEALECLLMSGHDGGGDYVASVESAKRRAHVALNRAKGE